ncbi:MAG: metallophosphoesterase family protein [Acidobacteria bacterium]|nr:metallophosphoesterase family protein [Acidobacteriota bacterium]
MTTLTAGYEVTRDLESRLSRRRTIEAGIHGHKWKVAHRDSFISWDDIARPVLNTFLKATGLYSRGVRNALRPIIRYVRLEFEDLPPSFDGFRILHLADLHIDALGGLAEVVAGLVASLDVDLCVMTGDYRFKAQGPCDGIYPGMQRILSTIRTELSVLGILGNHDESEIAIELENLGVRMLINETAEISRGDESLYVIGVDDPHCYGCDDLDGALEGVPEDGFKVLLAHTPEIYEKAARSGIHLYLCGHTHAGQIRLPFIGEVFQNTDCPRAYAQGEWRHDGMLGYTSAGVGCSLVPVRYNCPPEIPVIELASK